MGSRPVCEICKQSTMPVITTYRPESSEYYCMPCHKSYPMTKNEYALEMQIRRGSAEVVAAK